MKYSEAIKKAYFDCMYASEKVFVIGQGLWSPWYVGKTMDLLDKTFGKNRVIDTPISESAVTAIGVGAAIENLYPIIVHPRIDFALYAFDAIINESAKWSYLSKGEITAGPMFRLIINRRGEQGAQHSQSLQSFFAHIPGLEVFMPVCSQQAYDMFIYGTFSKNPVIYIDDRVFYEKEEEVLIENHEILKPKFQESFYKKTFSLNGKLTVISVGDACLTVENSRKQINKVGKDFKHFALTSLTKINFEINGIGKHLLDSNHLIIVENSWKTCSISSEILAQISELGYSKNFKSLPKRFNLPDCPTPSAKRLEDIFYISEKELYKYIIETI